MKKFLTTAILAAALIFTAAPNNAEAYDYYVGTSSATGWKCYVMTETFREIEEWYVFDVRLKMVTNSGNIKYLDYHFWPRPGSRKHNFYYLFKNSQGYSGKAVKNEAPIEAAIAECYYDWKDGKL